MEWRCDSGATSLACWASLPADIVLMVEEYLRRDGAAGHTASMRATCRTWRQALVAAPAELQPLGKPAHLAAFPRAVELDYAARGAGQALTDAELEAACSLLGPRLQRLDVGGAFQLTPEGMLRALRSCPMLCHLAADGSTLQDAAFGAPPPAVGGSSGSSSSGGSSIGGGSLHLRQLQSLSLRGCLYLRGSLLGDLAEACPGLTSLDLAHCGLALNLHPEVAALLPRLPALRCLVLDGNGLDEGGLRHVAALPHLRELSVRGSTHLTDASLHFLAQQRGSSFQPRSSSSNSNAGGGGGAGSRRDSSEAGRGSGDSSSSGSSSGGDGGVVDVGLVSLDISGCSGLTDQCWLAITEMQGLTSLRMEHMTHLLQFPSMPEQLPAALWRLPRLRLLSLAGSCCHPSKLKLLASTCGGSITHLDIGTGGSSSSSGASSLSSSSSSYGRAPPLRLPGWHKAAPWQLQPAGPTYRRLTSLHERDLCEAAQSFRQLQWFSAAGSALPLRVCTAFLEAAPAGRLTHADFSGCCMEAEHPVIAAAHSQQPAWQRQLFFSSGARRALNFDSYPAVTGTSASRLQQLHEEADSWQRPATAGRFAAALRRQAPSLSTLCLAGASGVTDRHLSSLRSLGCLTELSLRGTQGAVSGALIADAAAGCRQLAVLDISDTSAGDSCLAAAAALPSLCQLAAAKCSQVSSMGVAALAAGPAAASLRWLDLSGTSADDVAAAELAGGCPQLLGLRLTGCSGVTAGGAQQLCQLHRMEHLSLGRCPEAVTDSSLAQLAAHLPLLTALDLSEAPHLTAAGLAAAVPQLPCLADLNLTCCWQLGDDQLLAMLAGGTSSDASGASSSGGSSTSSDASGASGSGGSGSMRLATPANVQLPQGSNSPTGSPFKRRISAVA